MDEVARAAATHLRNLLLDEHRCAVVVRHPESLKNVSDIHGGPGAPLTDNGRACSRKIAQYLRCLRPEGTWRIVTGRATQSEEACATIAAIVSGQKIVAPALRGIDLGKIASLSTADAAERFPEARRMLTEWSARRISLAELSLPGGEPPASFVCRVSKTLASMAGPENLAYVATRSTMILVWNILELGERFCLRNYFAMEWRNGEALVCEGGEYRRVEIC